MKGPFQEPTEDQDLLEDKQMVKNLKLSAARAWSSQSLTQGNLSF